MPRLLLLAYLASLMWFGAFIGCTPQKADEEEVIMPTSAPTQIDIPEVNNLKLDVTFPQTPGAEETITQRIEVPDLGHVRCSIKLIAGKKPAAQVPLVLILHYGYTGRSPAPFTGSSLFPLYEEAFQETGAVLIAPDVLLGEWLSQPNELSAIWLAKSAAQTFPVDPQRIIVSGFSMGGKGTWFLAARHDNFFTGAIPIAGRAVDEQELDIPAFAIHSTIDNVVPISEAHQQIAAIKEYGGNVELKEISDLAHYDTLEYGAYIPQAMAWLEEQWSQQSPSMAEATTEQ